MANTHSLDLESTSSQFAFRADEAAISLTGDMTFECWLKPESNPSNYYGIGTKWDNSTSQRSCLFAINDNGLGQKQMNMFSSSDGSNQNIAWVNITLTLAAWNHYAWVYDASAGQLEAYINGVSQGTASGLHTSIFDGTKNFVVGAIDGADYYDGLIDDIRLWNDVRTVTEIADNYQMELVGTEAGLVGYWKVNNDYTDETSNALTLTSSGSPVFSVDIPSWPSGIVLQDIISPGIIAFPR